MPYVISCPTCRYPLTVAESAVAYPVSCPTCRYPLVVPASIISSVPASDFKFAEEDADVPAQKHGQKPDGSKGAAFILAMVFITVAGVAGYVISRTYQNVALFRSEPDGKAPQSKGAPAQLAVPTASPARLSDLMVAKIKHATVYLRVTTEQGKVYFGSGFFAGGTGYVVTNAHVVKGVKEVEVVIDSGTSRTRTLVGVVVAKDSDRDLAILRVTGSNLPNPLPLGGDRALKETHEIYIFGFPLGEDLGKEITVNLSSVSSLRDNGGYPEIQMNGGVNQGNSGGPVVDSMGNVVGVVVSKIQGTEIDFAIPSDSVRLFLKRVTP